MPSPATARRAPDAPDENDASERPTDLAAAAPWLAVVVEKVKAMRYGVVQIVVHDSKVVQIERTERTRFEVPPSAQGR